MCDRIAYGGMSPPKKFWNRSVFALISLMLAELVDLLCGRSGLFIGCVIGNEVTAVCAIGIVMVVMGLAQAGLLFGGCTIRSN